MLYNIDISIHQHELAIDVHMSPPFWTSLSPPFSFHTSRLSQAPVWVPWVIQQIFIGYLFYIQKCICFHATLSIHLTLSFLFSALVCKSVLYICILVAALQIGSSVPSLYIPYISINIWYLFFSFWLTSLCIIVSRFIQFIRTELAAFLFMAVYSVLKKFKTQRQGWRE